MAPDAKSVQASSYLSLHSLGAPRWSSRDFTALAQEGYMRNAIVYRCVRLVAEAAASVPLCVGRNGKCEAGDPARGLLDNPAPGQTLTEILETAYGYLQLAGQAVLHTALIDELPGAIYALRPDRVQPVYSREGRLIRWEVESAGVKRSYAIDPLTGKSPILSLTLFHPTDDVSGFSPLAAAAQAVDTHNAGGVWNKALLDNSARPSGALIYKGAGGADHLSDEQFDRLKAELDGVHTGPRAAGRPLLLEGGLDWRPMGLTPSDMDFIEARREAAREIALALGVPPMLLGIPGDNTYSNYREAQLALWQDTVRPLVTKMSGALQNWLRPFLGDDLTLVADWDSVPALAASRQALWERLSSADFLTRDEKRQLAGLPPLSDGGVDGT